MYYPFRPLSIPLLSSTNNIDIGNVSDSVVDLSEAIHNYGIAIVTLAVFFVIFIILMVLMLYNNTKMMNQIISSKSASDDTEHDLISKFVDNALDSKGIKDSDIIIKSLTDELKKSLAPIESTLDHINDENKEDYHKDLVGAYIDINMAFKDISRSTMNSLKCDRIGIYIFHNGNKSMHGLPFFKMSCIHEWTSHGNNTLRGKSHNDLPLHLFNDFIENLWNYGVYRSENVDTSIQSDHSIKEFIAFSNTKSLYLVAMKDDDGALTGFVVAEFSKLDTFEQDKERDDHVRGILDNMISKIAPIVGNKYIYRSCEK